MRKRLLTTCALAFAAYHAGRRSGLVDGEVRGVLRAGSAFMRAAGSARA